MPWSTRRVEWLSARPHACPAHGVAQVQHALALDDGVRIVQQQPGAWRSAEVRLASAVHDWGDVDRNPLDEAEHQRLPADVARRHTDVAIPGEIVGEREGGLH
jgi:hypothetical protein